MPYANGAATSPIDLLQQLVSFLVANGWAQDMSAGEGAGWRAHLHKSGNYVHLRAAMNEGVFASNNATNYSLALYLGTGFNGATDWKDQAAGAPVGAGEANLVGVMAALSVGPFANHYFFTDATADNIVVVVERTPGLFVHLGWGLSLQKAGAWTGGPYFFGSSNCYEGSYAGAFSWPTAGYNLSANCPGDNGDAALPTPVCYVRADVDSFIGLWVCINPVWSTPGGTNPSTGWTGKCGASTIKGKGVAAAASIPVYSQGDGVSEFEAMQTSVMDGRANLLPVYLFALRDGTTTGYSLLGSMPMCFYSNAVGRGFSNATEYAIGAQTYKLFPNFAVQKVS